MISLEVRVPFPVRVDARVGAVPAGVRVDLGRPPRRTSSTRRLRRAMAQTGAYYRRGATPTVRHLLSPLGGEGSALGAALVALPFLSPVTLGPLTSAGSLLILLLGWQLLRQQDAVLPERLLDVRISEAVHRMMDRILRRVARAAARLSRPRFCHLVEGLRGRILCGLGIIGGAVLLALPIPLLPFANTLPALAIVCCGLGRAERDGLLVLVGTGLLLLSTAYFAVFGTAVALLGWEAMRGALP